MEQCPKCFGRGYTLTYPKGRIITHNCIKCNGRGEIPEKKAKVKDAQPAREGSQDGA